jgi:glutathione synthase/RimK-type ligase-like ATP-grasp enzyme
MNSTLILYKKGKTGRTGLALRKRLGCYSTRGLDNGRVSRSWVQRVIRWGSTEMSELDNLPTLNNRLAVSLSSNKLAALQALNRKGVSVPWFTNNRDAAISFVSSRHKRVVGRQSYHQGGSNFNICGDSYDISNDRLSSHWLELINVQQEWRAHVFKGEVIGVSRKTDEGVEWRITSRYTRNNHCGWRFIRCDIDMVQTRLKQLAIDAVNALGLDFGAVDIILSDGQEATSSGTQKYYVLEVNTACGMEEDSTIFSAYLSKFKEWEYNNRDMEDTWN